MALSTQTTRARSFETTRAAITDSGGLISVVGLAEVWGMARQSVRYYTDQPDCPAPIPINGTDVLVWLREEVCAWKEERGDLRLTT